jgi:2-polyprenyl-3-methyl-5-hydroxy-6-metoxy-1,4-benzoquinol methylase
VPVWSEATINHRERPGDVTDQYVLGRTTAEAQRLQFQASVYAPHSTHLFRLAGIMPGMRVLDAGCGVGDVSMLLAELVGPRGTVTGIDMDSAALEVARARCADAGLINVTFINADLTGLELDLSADALAGRLIMLHLKDPAAAVRALSRLVRPGGVVTFQEFNASRARAVPPTPLVARCVEWITVGFRAGGVNVDVGELVPSILHDAGLTVRGAATAGPAGSAESPMPELLVSTLRSLMPVLLSQGQVTEAEIDIDTIAERVTHELKEVGATYWGPELAAAWAIVP